MDPAMETVRAAVIGLGVGERHLESYARIPGVAVVAVCDQDPVRLAAVADRHGIARRHADHRAITEDPAIDVVSICTYDDVHAEQAVSALRHGKHVMVEKPLAVTRAQADAVAAAHRESGRLLTSNLILRRSPRFRELQRRIAAGDLGTPYYLEGDYIHHVPHKLTDGWRGRISFYSPLLGGGIHLVDLLCWLAGDRVATVAAMGGALATAGTGYRFDDTEAVLLRFAGGALAKVMVTLTPQHPFFHAVRVFGTRASFENRPGAALWHTGPDPAGTQAVSAAYPGYDKGDLLPDFIAAIRTGGRPAVDAADVFHVMDVCLAAEESRAQGRFVAVPQRPAP